MVRAPGSFWRAIRKNRQFGPGKFGNASRTRMQVVGIYGFLALKGLAETIPLYANSSPKNNALEEGCVTWDH
jgi:hypothetical protein